MAINAIPDGVLPYGEWFIITTFDTIVYFDPESGMLRHDDVAVAPRNLTLRSGPSGVDVIMTDPATGLPQEKYPNLRVLNGGSIFNIALVLDGEMLTAQPAGTFAGGSMRFWSWEVHRLAAREELYRARYWRPHSPQGGTQLMHDRISEQLKDELAKINLKINRISTAELDDRPLVVWIHNTPNPHYDWCNEVEYVSKVAAFVFVSNWQRQAFVDAYNLPLDRCSVISNCIAIDGRTRVWPEPRPWRWRCAYISAPFRGLRVLLRAWEDLSPENAELHIWSGVSLWGFPEVEHRNLFSQAMQLPNVHFHRIASNDVIRNALLDMHFLVYPSTYPETFCISAVEAMASGCRVIGPSYAALPETIGAFANMYPYTADEDKHVELFKKALVKEFEAPWQGQTELSTVEQQYCRDTFDVRVVSHKWRTLISDLRPE